jgi:hypothetical protein
MIQKYCTYHTIVFLVVAFSLKIFNIGRIHYSINDFTSSPGKVMFACAMAYMVLPVLIHIITMLGNMLNNSKWLWLFMSLLSGLVVTPIYYFKVYTSINAHNQSLKRDGSLRSTAP